MSRSKDLFYLQKYDSALDAAAARIREISAVLEDNTRLNSAREILTQNESVFAEKSKEFKRTETAVEDHNIKIDQNQKRLYGGAITNPKELEDLQLESNSLQKYLLVLEEKQLEAMLDMEDAESEMLKSQESFESIKADLNNLHASLSDEKTTLENEIKTTTKDKEDFLAGTELSDLPTYLSLRKSSGGLAVTLMVGDSCSSCGANIPSAIAQQARSPGILAFCPTCKRILHPG